MDLLSSDRVNRSKPSFDQLNSISEEMESKSAKEVIRWALESYVPHVALASSFGAVDAVLIDLICEIDGAHARIFTLDTGRLNQETYDVMEDVRKRYGVTIEVFFPDSPQVEEMVTQKGINLMYGSIENRKLCCKIRKVDPLKRALTGLECWITGLRREQTITRNEIKKIEIDSAHGNIVKLNPLADWTSDQIWKFIRDNEIPYNKLHDLGYPSIGCAPCTRAVKPGEDSRAGRWWWENSSHKECGLHWDPVKNKSYRSSKVN